MLNRMLKTTAARGIGRDMLVIDRALARRFATTTVRREVGYIVNHDKIENPQNTKVFIDNQLIESKASTWIDLHDPVCPTLQLV